MVLGLLLAVIGASLAVAPLGAARFAAWARFAPYSTEPAVVRYYRAVGAAMAVVGVVLAVVLA